MSAIARGLRNPFRTRVRSSVAISMLAIVLALFALLVRRTLQTRQRLEELQAQVRTVVELREAGVFGTGGSGGDRPAGADEFSTGLLELIRQIPSAAHIVRIDEHIHAPQVDPT